MAGFPLTSRRMLDSVIADARSTLSTRPELARQYEPLKRPHVGAPVRRRARALAAPDNRPAHAGRRQRVHRLSSPVAVRSRRNDALTGQPRGNVRQEHRRRSHAPLVERNLSPPQHLRVQGADAVRLAPLAELGDGTGTRPTPQRAPYAARTQPPPSCWSSRPGQTRARTHRTARAGHPAQRCNPASPPGRQSSPGWALAVDSGRTPGKPPGPPVRRAHAAPRLPCTPGS